MTSENAEVIFRGEVQLLGWSDTHNGGAKLVLQLSDPADLEPFKHLTAKHGKIAGQILGAVIVKMGGAEQPQRSRDEPEADEAKPKGGALAKLAGMWCRNITFQEWLRNTYPTEWGWSANAIAEPDQAELAHSVVLQLCRIPSFVYLDSPAGEFEQSEFHRLIRLPFSDYLTTKNATPT